MPLRAILFDMDGVLYNDRTPIEGAVDALRWVERQNIPHLFVTNTTSHSRAWLAEKLNRLGFPGSTDQILTPSAAASVWLKSQQTGKVALFIRESARSEFEGLDWLPEDAEIGADYVVIGDLGRLWDYATLNRAFRLLHHNPEAKLIALGMTRYWLAEDGISLDAAPFVVALEHASRRSAIVLGKPSEDFFLTAAQKLMLPPSDLLMIGDDIEADVAGAQAAGIRGALVRTGKFRPSDLQQAKKPDVILDSVSALPGWWSENRNR